MEDGRKDGEDGEDGEKENSEAMGAGFGDVKDVR